MTYVMLGRRFTLEEWDAVCSRCGLCCYEKYEERGRVVFTDTPCRFLGEDNACKVYAHRLQACSDCHEVSPEVVLQGDLLPQECTYVQLAQGLAAEQLAGLATKEAREEEREEDGRSRCRGRWFGGRKRQRVR